MNIKTVVVGKLLNNTYIITTKQNNAVIIDPGIEFDKILPTTIDIPNDGYIAFEFALDNEKLLGETDEGAQQESPLGYRKLLQ